MIMKIKLCRPNAKLPTLGSEKAAGYDLYAAIDEPVTIYSHKTVLIPTGVAIEIPDDFAAYILARSGLALKKDLAPANKLGLIDPDYRGELMVALHNHGEYDQEIQPGDRIAQLVFLPRCMIIPDEDGNIWQVVDELSDTERGSGGFGSTGTN